MRANDDLASAPFIANGHRYPVLWAAAANAFRAVCRPERMRTNLAYGAHPRERLDLYLPQEKPNGLLVFVHGGDWRWLDREMFSHLAAGPLGRGWAVALPGYPLAPEVRISAITRSVASAIDQVARVVRGPVILAGHCAGAQLAARQICRDSILSPVVQRRITRLVAISGLHDLRPCLGSHDNRHLRLDEPEAAAESPALQLPHGGKEVQVWVGGAERPEFIRQSRLLATIWAGFDLSVDLTMVPGRHHFDVVDALQLATSDLSAAATGG